MLSTELTLPGDSQIVGIDINRSRLVPDAPLDSLRGR